MAKGPGLFHRYWMTHVRLCTYYATIVIMVFMAQERPKDKQVRPSSGTAVYPHMPILRLRAMRYSTKGTSVAVGKDVQRKLYYSAAGRLVWFWASGGANFSKIGHSLPRTPMNHRAKFDATSFVLAGEIRNRTNTHTQIGSNWYIHTLPIGMCG